jgi:hypothetical protein
MKILYLTLKGKWYDDIESGYKSEEYREINPYWVNRLCNEFKGAIGGEFMDRHAVISYTFKDFTHVHFARGGHFGNVRQMRWEIKEIVIGLGLPKWGAELDKEYFVIKLGQRCPIELQNAHGSVATKV